MSIQLLISVQVMIPRLWDPAPRERERERKREKQLNLPTLHKWILITKPSRVILPRTSGLFRDPGLSKSVHRHFFVTILVQN